MFTYLCALTLCATFVAAVHITGPANVAADQKISVHVDTNPGDPNQVQIFLARDNFSEAVTGTVNIPGNIQGQIPHDVQSHPDYVFTVVNQHGSVLAVSDAVSVSVN